MTPDHSASDLRARLDWSDAQLLRECEVHTYRASGPGGQHRNKTSSAVRLHHGPSGLIVPATESRSQHQNKVRALKRLREALAISFRCELLDQISWPDGSPIVGGRLQVGKRSPHRFHILAIVLDVLAENAGRLRESAERLCASGSSLTSFLADYPKAWAEANRIRAAAGLSRLRR